MAALRTLLLTTFALSALLLAGAPASRAQPDPRWLERGLHAAMREVVTVARDRPIAHCRQAGIGEAGPWERCDARLWAFAGYLAESARAHRVSAWTLLAIAVHETGLDPFATGRIGERGIMQLNPRTAGRRVRFVTSGEYRRQCRELPGACQAEVVDAGAEHLAGAILTCQSEALGVGAYAEGICAHNRYAERIAERLADWPEASVSRF